MDLSTIKNLCEGRPGGIKKLAEDIGMTEANLHRCIRLNKIQAKDLESIAGLLNVPISYFFGGTSSITNLIQGDNNQLNEHGSHDNTNSTVSDQVLKERVKSLETIVAEKDERIKDLKERIDELKARSN
jgi:transcriptional regulator with XRE-family HTH domain